jgi:glycosyltransferase involved in cell wall biosynthesis
MSSGLVPVVTDLEGGIREAVTDNMGFRITIDDNEAFALAIQQLDDDRSLLEVMSVGCRAKVAHDYDIKSTSAAYFRLFARYGEFFKIKHLQKSRQGSRLDAPYIPNSFTRFLRGIRRS